MSYDVLARGALNYFPCRYAASRLLFRGPARRLDAPYVAFLGGTEIYGKYIKAPLPALVESDLGVNCVNFGQPNAGVDVFLKDPFVLSACGQSDVTVLQVMGAQNLSNRFYSVHPRRNDRFVYPSTLLRTIYSEVDFSEFHFNRHMLSHLLEVSPSRFAAVRAELEAAWLARMNTLIDRIEGKVVLLWMADHAPHPQNTMETEPDLYLNPLFVSREMINEVRESVDDYVEVVVSEGAVNAGTEGMFHSEMEAAIASQVLGPRAHGEAALALGPVLHQIIDT